VLTEPPLQPLVLLPIVHMVHTITCRDKSIVHTGSQRQLAHIEDGRIKAFA
jgi:hypothetical protein